MGRAFWQGFRAGAPFVLVVAPFGLLFGVVAAEAGLDIVQTMAMTVLVIAGASQFAAVQLLSDNAPTIVAILTGLAVNMRMAMYSASLTPHLGKASLGKRALAAYFFWSIRTTRFRSQSMRKTQRGPCRKSWRFSLARSPRLPRCGMDLPLWARWRARPFRRHMHWISRCRSRLSPLSPPPCAACPISRRLLFRSRWRFCWRGCPIIAG